MKKKPSIKDQAWYLHLESIRKMEDALVDEDVELKNIISYIGYQNNRARA